MEYSKYYNHFNCPGCGKELESPREPDETFEQDPEYNITTMHVCDQCATAILELQDATMHVYNEVTPEVYAVLQSDMPENFEKMVQRQQQVLLLKNSQS